MLAVDETGDVYLTGKVINNGEGGKLTGLAAAIYIPMMSW
jgi:hypothetical protein